VEVQKVVKKPCRKYLKSTAAGYWSKTFPFRCARNAAKCHSARKLLRGYDESFMVKGRPLGLLKWSYTNLPDHQTARVMIRADHDAMPAFNFVQCLPEQTIV